MDTIESCHSSKCFKNLCFHREGLPSLKCGWDVKSNLELCISKRAPFFVTVYDTWFVIFSEDIGSNNSGYYELTAVLTHQGRSSSSGHYLAWIRRKGGNRVHCSLSDTQSSHKLLCLSISLIFYQPSLWTYSRESKRPENRACIFLTQTTKCKA